MGTTKRHPEEVRQRAIWMVATTNKSVREWTELLAGDEVLATAVHDRLLHRASVLNTKGHSCRLRDPKQALASQKA